jgi:hypothetical protein
MFVKGMYETIGGDVCLWGTGAPRWSLDCVHGACVGWTFLVTYLPVSSAPAQEQKQVVTDMDG